MTLSAGILLAVLSIWDYPARQATHERLRAEFVQAVRQGDYGKMATVSRQGVQLLPDDPTWRYNLACALAHGKDRKSALETLEKAIDLGFRSADAIANDPDFQSFAKDSRFQDALERADRLRDRPILTGPMAVVPATGSFGEMQSLGEQNLGWDFDTGVFAAQLKLSGKNTGGNCGDLYFNRDGDHSLLVVTNYPGLTRIKFDKSGRDRGMDLDFPNVLLPYPVFGNASRALVSGPMRRSIPRAMMTTAASRLKVASRLYRENQVWVFPAAMDYPTTACETLCSNDVYASVAPYWIVTQGRSWSDQYYLRAALEASRSLQPKVKEEIVARGHLAPVMQVLLRQALKDVKTEEDYLTSKAHPTCFPPNGLDLARLKKSAAALRTEAIPPVAGISAIQGSPVQDQATHPELTYATPFAWAFVLRSSDTNRTFLVRATGAQEYAFAAVHDEKGAAQVERVAPDVARVTLDRSVMTVTNRVDVAVFGKNAGTGWGAPAYVSFAVVDPTAPYSDPFLTPRPVPAPAKSEE